mmetsp:Transcript_13905/g.25623  ORF Transcript_13905/g.25623 Transcript_13905/m.25623 type:complete len:230 (+) Transcript_13905:60-749(+)
MHLRGLPPNCELMPYGQESSMLEFHLQQLAMGMDSLHGCQPGDVWATSGNHTTNLEVRPNCPCSGNRPFPAAASHPFALRCPCRPCCPCLPFPPCFLFHPCCPCHPCRLFRPCCPYHPYCLFPSYFPCPARQMGSQQHPCQLAAEPEVLMACLRSGRLRRPFQSPCFPEVLAMQRKVLPFQSLAAGASPSFHLCPSALSRPCHPSPPPACHHRRNHCLSLSHQSQSRPG